MNPMRLLLCVAVLCSTLAGHAADVKFLLVAHGGAGGPRKELTSERERESREVMARALRAGHSVLATNGTSLDAIEVVIRILEDSPLFNAGKGAVLTSQGTAELDASIMEGRTMRGGAVAGVRRIKNPISAARMVMEKSPHVLMAREGAEAFVKEHGVERISPRYFITPYRKQELERIQENAKAKKNSAAEMDTRQFIGTVGAVALDSHGNLAAGTSTGGMVNKKFGRIGDSPIIGAGTYAKNATCAVSCTGHGEYFIRSAVAHDVSALMEYKNLPLREAAEEALRRVGELGGKGGFIAIDRQGNIATPFNTEGLFRGIARENGEVTIEVYPATPTPSN
jgi:beta-aspartyl-peptidase (threonine type)